MPFVPWGVDTHGGDLADAQNGDDLLPTKSRGRLVCQGQGNELVVTVARSWRLQGGRKTREDVHPMIRHSLLLSGTSFSVESTDSRWRQYEEAIPGCGKINPCYCPTAAPRENLGRFSRVEFYWCYHGKNPITVLDG